MTQGITGLPGAQPPQPPQGMPQGAPPGAMPQPPQQPQQAATPMAMTGQLEKLPPQQLLAMFGNPMDKTPKWAVVSAYAKAIENQRMMDSVRNQSAMQQAQAQGQMPIAAQVMSQPIQPAEPVMARDGGIMSGYAGGGAVAFKDAGVIGLQNPEYDEEGLPRTNEERERIERNNLILLEHGNDPAFLAQQQKTEPYRRLIEGRQATRSSSSPVPKQMQDFYRSKGREQLNLRGDAVPSAPFAFGPPEGPMMEPPEIAIAETLARPPAPAPSGANRGSAGSSASSSSKSRAASAPSGSMPGWTMPTEKEYMDQQAGIEALIRQQGQVDPAVLRAREAYYKGQEGRLSARDARSLEALKRAQEASSTPLLGNQEALLRLAGSLGGAKRLGEGLSMAAKEAGTIRGEQRRTVEKMQELRAQEQNALDSLRDAMEVKKVADINNDTQTSRTAAMEIQKSRAQLLEVRRAMFMANEELNLKRREVAAKEEAARASAGAQIEGRESRKFAQLSGLLAGLERNKQADLIKVKEAHQKNPEYSVVYKLAGVGAPMSPAQQAIYNRAEKELAQKLASIETAYANRFSPIEKELYGAPIGSMDLSQWTNFSVK